MVKKTILNKLKKFKLLLKAEGIPVARLFLYGSHARGTAREDSDIDVCVVSSVFGKDRVEERFRLLHLGPRVDARIEAVPFSPHEFRYNRVSPLLHEIRKDAIEIK